jgi:flavin reductase (DIM6/NTAB) family NADH-FMN oxidoreductase RutF
MKFDPKNLKHQSLSHLLTDIVVPRPIAWVSTVSDKGIYNLAPFSAYAMVGTNPMVVCLTVNTNRDGKKKDTILNLELTKEFVISVVTEDLAEAMNKTSAPYPRDVSEYEKAGLTPIKADIVKAPMVGESPINMECSVLQILEFGKTPIISDLVIGEVLLVHIADELFDTKTGRISGLKAVGRLGGDGDLYCRTRDTFQMKRPTL